MLTLKLLKTSRVSPISLHKCAESHMEESRVEHLTFEINVGYLWRDKWFIGDRLSRSSWFHKKEANWKVFLSKSRDGEVSSKKELSSYFEELLVVKFLVKRNLVPQMRNFSPTLSKRVTVRAWKAVIVTFIGGSPPSHRDRKSGTFPRTYLWETSMNFQA